MADSPNIDEPDTDSPLVDLDPEQVPDAVGTISAEVAPFIPAKIRAWIYGVAGVLAVVATASAPVLGGQVGDWLGVTGAACAAVGGTTALAHTGRQ